MCINPIYFLLCYKLGECPVILKEGYNIIGQGFTKLTIKHGGHVKPFLKYKLEK